MDVRIATGLCALEQKERERKRICQSLKRYLQPKKEATEGNYGAAAGLAGSMGDTSLASTSVEKVISLSVSEYNCAAIVDYLPEEPPSSMSAVESVPKTNRIDLRTSKNQNFVAPSPP